jgi:hypothetical protein
MANREQFPRAVSALKRSLFSDAAARPTMLMRVDDYGSDEFPTRSSDVSDYSFGPHRTEIPRC